jgi:DNA helicase-2/ATP-dependent DNA helicase PcrA
MFEAQTLLPAEPLASPVVPEPGEPSWLAELNPEQRAAATHEGDALLILAGAGTGKTTTLSARVAWLLSRGVPAERILLLTFTRRAAREMLGRVRAHLPARSARGRVLGGTFHSVAHRMVRLHASALGLPPGFGVLDASDAADLFDLVRQEHDHGEGSRRFPRKATLLDVYSRTVNAQRPLVEVLAEAFPWCEEHREAIAALARDYGARKKRLGVLDLDDLLLHWRALARDPVVGPRLAGMFAHVLVDEYQDVNGLQVDIVRALHEGGAALTVVGDDMQAIYGFRAASARHILDFPERFPAAQIKTLEANYRSTRPILAVANQVSAEAEEAHPKVLRTPAAGGERPELVFCLDEGAQAAKVCEWVLAARERGMELRAQAVLMRTTHDSDLLELELARRSIPFVKYGGLRYLEAAHVKDFIALLRLADNPADEVSWFRVLQLLDGVGPATARRALAALEPAAGDVLSRWPAAEAALPPGARAPAAALAEAMDAGGEERRPGVRAERLREALAPLVTVAYPDGGVRLEDLDRLVAAAAQASDLGHFVAELVLDPPASSADLAQPPHLDEDYLVLSTVHSAKGLEWDAVHVIGAYDGNFPACLAAGSREGIAEERRLLYVALTRARRALHVYVPLRYFHRPRGVDDGHGYGKASRFLSERVQALCRLTHHADPLASAESPAVGGGGGARTIAVSVDDLFA